MPRVAIALVYLYFRQAFYNVSTAALFLPLITIAVMIYSSPLYHFQVDTLLLLLLMMNYWRIHENIDILYF